MALQRPLLARLAFWLRENPSFWIIALAVAGYAVVRHLLSGYMLATEWVTEPIYNPFVKGWTSLNGSLAEIPSYTYALVARSVPLPPQLSVWPAVIYGSAMLTCFSLMVACLSFLKPLGTAETIRFWVIATLVLIASAFLVFDVAAGSPTRGLILRGWVIVVNAGLFYVFSQLYPLRLGARFLAILAGNATWFASLYFLGNGWPAYTLWAGYSAPVVTILACLFAFQSAYFLPYGALLLAVRQNVNGIFAFLLILVFVAGNVLLGYLETTGTFHDAIFSPDGLWLLAILALCGLQPFQRFVAEDASWFTIPSLAKPLYAAWAGLTFAFLAWSIGSENQPLTEVIEDAANLSIIAVSGGFAVFVLANFAGPLAQSQRVDRVLFQPYRLPISAVMAIAATVIYLFFANANKFQLYQAEAGSANAVADGYFLRRDYQSADLFYQEATAGDYYNFHSNYMLAQLARARGSETDADEYLKRSVFTKPQPEGYLALSERARELGFFQTTQILTEGRNRFPKDERLASNLLVAYLGSALTDSVTALAHILESSTNSPVQTNLLAASNLKKLEGQVRLPSGGLLANRYQGQRTGVDACALVRASMDTADMRSMASFLGLYNGAVLCDAPTPPPPRLDSLIRMVEAGYEEDLLYARAWLLWNSANRLQAMEDMLTLARAKSLSTPTYAATALAWASELQPSAFLNTLARNVWADSLAALSPALNPKVPLDVRLRNTPFAQVPEAARGEWLLAGPPVFQPQQIAGLMRDFRDPVAQRLFLLAAARQNVLEADRILKESLPVLMPATQAAAQALDRQLGWLYAEYLINYGQPVASSVPKAAQASLAMLEPAAGRLSQGKLRSSDIQMLVAAFPYSIPVLGRISEVVDKDPALSQVFFEAIARAYALDHRNPVTQNAYIQLARKLNLDAFAEAAEAEAKENPLNP